MNILFDIYPKNGWARAANYLGHNGYILDNTCIFDCFNKIKPDLFIVNNRIRSDELNKAIESSTCKVIEIPKPIFGADCPPDFISGIIKEEFKCEVIIIGQYNNLYNPYISMLSNNNIKFKIFGHGEWNVPQYLGSLPDIEIANAYKSAKWSIDFQGDEGRILAITIAGGSPISNKKWKFSNIDNLDNCPYFSSPRELFDIIKSEPLKFSKTPTLTDQLSKIIKNYK